MGATFSSEVNDLLQTLLISGSKTLVLPSAFAPLVNISLEDLCRSYSSLNSRQLNRLRCDVQDVKKGFSGVITTLESATALIRALSAKVGDLNEKKTDLVCDSYELLLATAIVSKGMSLFDKVSFISALFDVNSDSKLSHDEVVLMFRTVIRVVLKLRQNIKPTETGYLKIAKKMISPGVAESIARDIYTHQGIPLSDPVDIGPVPPQLTVSSIMEYCTANSDITAVLRSFPCLPDASMFNVSDLRKVHLDDPLNSSSTAGPLNYCRLHHCDNRSGKECRLLTVYEVILCGHFLSIMRAQAYRAFDGTFRKAMLVDLRRLLEKTTFLLPKTDKGSLSVLTWQLVPKFSPFQSWLMAVHPKALPYCSLRKLLAVICPCATEEQLDGWIGWYLTQCVSRRKLDITEAKEAAVTGKEKALPAAGGKKVRNKHNDSSNLQIPYDPKPVSLPGLSDEDLLLQLSGEQGKRLKGGVELVDQVFDMLSKQPGGAEVGPADAQRMSGFGSMAFSRIVHLLGS